MNWEIIIIKYNLLNDSLKQFSKINVCYLKYNYRKKYVHEFLFSFKSFVEIKLCVNVCMFIYSFKYTDSTILYNLN